MKHGTALGHIPRPSTSAHIRHYFRMAIALCFVLLMSACASPEKTMVATDPRVLGNYELKNVTVRLVPDQNQKVDPDDYARMTRHLAGEIRNSLARQGMATSPIDVDVTIKGLNFADTAGILLGGSIDFVLAEVNVTDPADPQRKLASFQTFMTQQYAMGGLIGVAVRQSQAPAEIRLAQQLSGEIWKKLNQR
jgi:hypothetical protein